jgi:hypothetical protein
MGLRHNESVILARYVCIVLAQEMGLVHSFMTVFTV